MADNSSWLAYLNSEFVPDSEDEEFFANIPPLPSPPSGFFYDGSGGVQGSEESAGGALMEDSRVPRSPIRRPIYRRPSTAMKPQDSDLDALLCTESWDDVVREREEVVSGDWWLRCSPLLRRMVYTMFSGLKG